MHKRVILVILIAAFCTCSTLLAGDLLEDLKPEISFAVDGTPLIPNIRPVIFMTGSDYNMGYQFAQQLFLIFGRWILEDVVNQDFSKEELDALKAYDWYIQKYTPEYVEMFRGMADGARDLGIPLSYADWLAFFTGTTTSYPTPPPGWQDVKLLPPEESYSGCSGFAAWGSATKDGKLICASSLDGGFRFGLTAVCFPEEGGHNYIVTFAKLFPSLGGWANHPSMNNSGVCYVHHGAGETIACQPEEERDYGITPQLGIIHTIRFADTAVEAKDMVVDYFPPGQGPTAAMAGLWADTDGNAFAIECKYEPFVVREPGDYGERDFLYAANNALAKELGREGEVYVEHGGWSRTGRGSSVERNLLMWNFLHNYHGEIDLEFVKMMWRFPGMQPGSSTTIGRPYNAMIGITLPDDGDEGLFYVCTGPANIHCRPASPYGSYYRADRTYSFYELKLASSPEEVTKAARSRAMTDLFFASVELEKLNYSDPAYAPLKELFNQAARELERGEFYREFANRISGNKSVYYLGKALRGYTRCQALARQVYNTLVPPPTRPSDLGLREWFGDWGDWADIP